MDVSAAPSAIASSVPHSSGSPFVTPFGVNDLLLARETGATVLGQVMGCSIFQIAAPPNSAISGELKFLTSAFADMQRTALERLRAEAVTLGADAVIGVTLRLKPFPITVDAGFLADLAVVGTAVSLTGSLRPRPAVGGGKPAQPVLCTFTARELSLLRRGGWRPAGLAIGVCAHYEIAKPPPNFRLKNVERGDYVRAMYAARSSALRRLQNEAAALKAAGVAGVTINAEHSFGGDSNGSRDLFVRFAAIGTAIEPIPHAGSHGLGGESGGNGAIEAIRDLSG